ncbi:SufE family protein [Candidatus Endolissoclinum faulkneri]|nr:SufE family protein [Candidatus Endolissoclinum faulkneri]
MSQDLLEDALKSSIEEEKAKLIEEFAFFDDWIERYEYLIDIGRKHPPLNAAYKIDEFKLSGCQSQVWLVAERLGDRLLFHATSDAAIVSGIIALLLRVYSNRTPEDIIVTKPDFIQAIGLDSHLSATRKSGLNAMLRAIKDRAQAELDHCSEEREKG